MEVDTGTALTAPARGCACAHRIACVRMCAAARIAPNNAWAPGLTVRQRS